MSCSIGINCVIEKEFTTRKIPCRYSDKIKLVCLFNVLNILGTLDFILYTSRSHCWFMFRSGHLLLCSYGVYSQTILRSFGPRFQQTSRMQSKSRSWSLSKKRTHQQSARKSVMPQLNWPEILSVGCLWWLNVSCN